MKKILIVLLAMLLLLSACGGPAGTSAPAKTDPPASSPARTDPTVAATTAAGTPAVSTATPTTVAATTGTTAAPAADPIRLTALKGPTAMGLVSLFDQADKGQSKNDYQVTLAAAVDEVAPLLVQGKTDLAAVPGNLASVLYNNTKGQIQVVALNTLGVLYICETGDSIKSFADLRGKTIYVSGKGATPEYVLNYLLQKNGLDPTRDVTIEFRSEHAELAALLASKEEAIALLPQPFVTVAQSKNQKIRVALDLTAEWDKAQAGETAPSALVMGVLVGRRDFLEKNQARVAAFLEEYEASVQQTKTDPAAVAKLIGAYEIVPEPVALKALPHCNITFATGKEMKQKLAGTLQVLFEQNPKAVGGALPPDDFYYDAP